eukprot:224480_1
MDDLSRAPQYRPYSLNDLPADVLLSVFEDLNGREMAAASNVCSQWNHLLSCELSDIKLWRDVYKGHMRRGSGLNNRAPLYNALDAGLTRISSERSLASLWSYTRDLEGGRGIISIDNQHSDDSRSTSSSSSLYLPLDGSLPTWKERFSREYIRSSWKRILSDRNGRENTRSAWDRASDWVQPRLYLAFLCFMFIMFNIMIRINRPDHISPVQVFFLLLVWILFCTTCLLLIKRCKEARSLSPSLFMYCGWISILMNVVLAALRFYVGVAVSSYWVLFPLALTGIAGAGMIISALAFCQLRFVPRSFRGFWSCLLEQT